MPLQGQTATHSLVCCHRQAAVQQLVRVLAVQAAARQQTSRARSRCQTRGRHREVQQVRRAKCSQQGNQQGTLTGYAWLARSGVLLSILPRFLAASVPTA